MNISAINEGDKEPNVVVLVADCQRDQRRYEEILSASVDELRFCVSGQQALDMLRNAEAERPDAAIIWWDIPGPPFALHLLGYCRENLPQLPLVVVADALDPGMGVRAVKLGARDFLQKPLDAERLRTTLMRVLGADREPSAVVAELQGSLIGRSPEFLRVLRYAAKVIPRVDIRVLLIGESGTGKELVAHGIHVLGPGKDCPWVAVNVNEIPEALAESQLFGHEKGAFTDAKEAHAGYLEQAGNGTLFLDEIGDLPLAVQGKLLRAIQERRFRKLKGQREIPFEARLICATNKNMEEAVRAKRFRGDLYHRIAEVTVRIPPLRARRNDVRVLMNHLLRVHAGGRPLRFTREALTFLDGYHFPGNVRELENIVRHAVIHAEDELILPVHLPLEEMAERDDSQVHGTSHEEGCSFPAQWKKLPYGEARELAVRAFDGWALGAILRRTGGNISRAAGVAGLDRKTLRNRARSAGLSDTEAEEQV